MNFDPCAWALRMSNTHLGFVYVFLPVKCHLWLKYFHHWLWEGSSGHLSERAADRRHSKSEHYRSDWILNIFQKYSLHSFLIFANWIDL